MVASLGNHFSDKTDIITLQHETGQSSGGIGARVDADSVRANFRLQDWCVAMHDDFAETVLVEEEILSDPEEVFFRLIGERDPWSYPCMDEEKIAANEVWF